MEELNETKSCPIKDFCRSKTFIITLACLLCFFIGFYAGSKYTPKKSTNFNRPRAVMPRTQQARRVTKAPNRIPKAQATTKPKTTQTKVAPTKPVAKKSTTKTTKATPNKK